MAVDPQTSRRLLVAASVAVACMACAVSLSPTLTALLLRPVRECAFACLIPMPATASAAEPRPPLAPAGCPDVGGGFRADGIEAQEAPEEEEEDSWRWARARQSPAPPSPTARAPAAASRASSRPRRGLRSPEAGSPEASAEGSGSPPGGAAKSTQLGARWWGAKGSLCTVPARRRLPRRSAAPLVRSAAAAVLTPAAARRRTDSARRLAGAQRTPPVRPTGAGHGT